MYKRKKPLADDFLQTLKVKFDDIYSATWPQREQCLEDRRFATIPGAQWEGDLEKQFENSPKPEVNKIMQSLIKIYDDYRRNKVTVDYVSTTGEEKDSLAETLEDLFRATVDSSCSTEATDNTFEDGVAGGFSALRISNQKLDDYSYEDNKQHLVIKPIYDAESSVFFDLDAKSYDKSDSTCCFVVVGMTRSKFEDLYDDEVSSWDIGFVNNNTYKWVTNDEVFVAEYFEIEENKEKLFVYEDLYEKKHYYFEDQFEEEEGLTEFIEDYQFKLLEEKKVMRKRVHKYILCGNRVLEDCGYIPGTCIPIIPFYGRRWFISGTENYCGHTRLLKDIQRLSNVQRARLMEIAALSPLSKPIFTSEQMSGNADLWAEDNIKKNPYLLVNPVEDKDGNEVPMGPVGYTKAPEIPQATVALMQTSENDMAMLAGDISQNEKVSANVSGTAMQEARKLVDERSSIYLTNWSKTMVRVGEVFQSMAPDVYIEKGRKIKGIGAQDETRSIELMKPMKQDSGEIIFANDLSKAKFTVKSTVGPSSSSKREATVNSLMKVLEVTTDQTTRNAISNTIINNMEGTGLEDLKKFNRMNLVRDGLIEPTDKETKELQKEQEAKQPSADQRYLETEAQKNEADVVKTLAQAEETQAKTEETRANTLQTLTEIGGTVNDLQMIKQAEIDEQPRQQIQ